MSNAYITLSFIKGTAALNFTGTAFDSRLLSLTENISRAIDKYCGRHFYPLTDTRTFDGNGGTTLLLPDFISIGTIKEDTNLDGTYETTWGANDALSYPYNASPTAEYGKAYWALLVNNKTNGTQDVWLAGQQNYQLIGTWGYRSYTEDTGERGSGTFAATGTLLTLTASSTLSVGQTVLIDSEWLYVTSTGTAGTATGTGVVSVQRSVNGSTAAAHSTGTVYTLIYPASIQEACFVQVAQMLKRRESAFASTVGFPETGQMFVFSGALDGDVKRMLAPYRMASV